MHQVSRGKVYGGRVVLPAEMRKEFGIEEGSEVVISRTEHGIEIKTINEAIRQAQELCAKYIKPRHSAGRRGNTACHSATGRVWRSACRPVGRP